MTFINMLTWWQWAILAAVPPAIVLLYFLKLKRTPLEVPSTFLWKKSIEDLHVNSIWQRLRTSLLLLLQLLLVLLVMAALVRPGWSGSRLIGNRYVFLIDNSASMQSRDVKPTRLDEAKRRAGELIEQMGSGDVAMIVSFSDMPRVEQAFTDNRRELLSRLDSIQPTQRRTSVEEALRVATGLAQSQSAAGNPDKKSAEPQQATLYLFSDGRFPDVKDAKLSAIKTVYVPIGLPTAENLAITAFTTRPREDDATKLQAFGRIQNFSSERLTADVELIFDGTLLDSAKVEIEPRESTGVVFDLGEIAPGVLELVTRGGGDLAVDDRAWTAVDPPRRSRVLVITPGDQALTLAASTASAQEIADVEIATPDILKTEEYRQRAAAGYWALVIYDQCRPAAMPQANTLFIGQLPPAGNWHAQGDQPEPNPQIVDVEISHPLMQLLDLGNVRFVEGTLLKPPKGSTALITTTSGPLMAIAPRGTWQDAVLGAEIVGVDAEGERFANTDWPLRVSFPVFILNTLNYLGGADAGGIPSIRPGDSVSLRVVDSAAPLTVRTPSGQSTSVASAGGQPPLFSDTDRTGVYPVEEAGQPVRHFAVNLFDAGESELVPREQLRLGLDEVTGQANWEGGRHELWRWLLCAVLGVLCLEWYIYNRRVYV